MRLTFHLIPHVHWDREWYLTRHGFLARLLPMLDRTLDLLDAHPALRFHLDGQTIIAEDYLSVAPDRRARLRAAVLRGQLALGPWYVLADELIPRGASLQRNLELGIAAAAELGGHARVLYSPDAFGHPAGLPDLAAQFGLPWAVLWRGLGRVGGRLQDLYRWTGPRGGSVLVYHLPPEGYEMGIGLVTAGADLPAQWRDLRRRMTARAVSQHVAILVGADHHTPSRELPALADRIGALEPDATVRFSGFDEFFRAVESAKPQVASLQGELRNSTGYVWSLQGVHSTRLRMKRRHAEVESKLLDVVEPLVAPAGQPRPALLDQAWRLLVQSQFHDTIAGCAADGVAREQQVRLDAAATIARELATAAIDRLIGHDPDVARRHPESARPALVLWHGGAEPFRGVVLARTSWFRRDVLVGPPGGRVPRIGSGYQPFHLRTQAGEDVPVQVMRIAESTERVDALEHYPDLDLVDEVWIAFRVRDLPPGRPMVLAACLGLAPGPPSAPDSVRTRPRSLRNDRIEAVVDRRGRIMIRDLRSGRIVRGIGVIESEPDGGDLYTPDIDRAGLRTARVVAVREIATGPLVGALELTWTVEPASGGVIRGRTLLSLHAGEPTLRILVEFDNWAENARLRFRLPLGLRDGVAVGSPFGAERRQAGGLDTSWADEAGLPTAPAHDWLASAEPGAGFRLDLPGFFEYELTDQGDVLVTLLRAVGALSKDILTTRRGHAGWTVPTPDGTESGRHVVSMTVGVEPVSRAPVRRWYRMASSSLNADRPGSSAADRGHVRSGRTRGETERRRSDALGARPP